jgi:hypothetical protein
MIATSRRTSPDGSFKDVDLHFKEVTLHMFHSRDGALGEMGYSIDGSYSDPTDPTSSPDMNFATLEKVNFARDHRTYQNAAQNVQQRNYWLMDEYKRRLKEYNDYIAGKSAGGQANGSATGGSAKTSSNGLGAWSAAFAPPTKPMLPAMLPEPARPTYSAAYTSTFDHRNNPKTDLSITYNYQERADLHCKKTSHGVAVDHDAKKDGVGSYGMGSHKVEGYGGVETHQELWCNNADLEGDLVISAFDRSRALQVTCHHFNPEANSEAMKTLFPEYLE